AITIADRIFKSVSNKRLTDVASHTIHYGHIVDPKTEQVVEEVMLSIMKGPKTFTREDIIEINCHGGIVSVNRVLQLVIA
ncbi:tRNA uridine-5-carboxymethylaminomethyl(34) synthesis GTPase MnmE, partial [Bacillus subtilis]|nr:tRNA uridine-5-carboxymethylaminomethyl(34) synthesis GTPase MnmE [Bacillus subtilis]